MEHLFAAADKKMSLCGLRCVAVLEKCGIAGMNIAQSPKVVLLLKRVGRQSKGLGRWAKRTLSNGPCLLELELLRWKDIEGWVMGVVMLISGANVKLKYLLPVKRILKGSLWD